MSQELQPLAYGFNTVLMRIFCVYNNCHRRARVVVDADQRLAQQTILFWVVRRNCCERVVY